MGVWALMKLEEDLTDAYYRARGLSTTGIDFELNGARSGTGLMGYVPLRWRPLREISWNSGPRTATATG
jgi:hypothetical protein